MGNARKWGNSDIYHCVSRGTGRQIIFEHESDYLHFLDLLTFTLKREDIELLAWCLMNNHVHLLLRAPLPKISRSLQRVLGTYARWFNKKAGRMGHLFQGRFDSEPVEDEAYFMTVVRYIHQIPTKALISTTEDYRWSSYHEYLGSKGPASTTLGLEIFGSRESYIEFHKVEGTEKCLDAFPMRSKTRSMPDSEAAQIARDLLGSGVLVELKGLPAEERDEGIRELVRNKLSVRQIERITGIGRNTVFRASKSVA